MVHIQAAKGTATTTTTTTTTTTNGRGNRSDADKPPSLRHICLELRHKIDAFLARDAETKLLEGLQSQVRCATRIINEAMERYRIEELSLSYNGGKDCLVLLVLILACLPEHYDETAGCWAGQRAPTHYATTLQDRISRSKTAPDTVNSSSSSSSSSAFGNTLDDSTSFTSCLTSQIPTNTPAPPSPVRPGTPQPFPTTLQSVYIVSPHPFAEVDAFVDASAATYHLDLCRYSLPMRSALGAYLAERSRVKAVFVGTRRSDPHGAHLAHFDPTDRDWPAFVRVHPIIDWHYAEIWAFLLWLEIPYLSLYDRGYTSLGGTEDTHPNPVLKKDGDGFRPAYELTEDKEERLGRFGN